MLAILSSPLGEVSAKPTEGILLGIASRARQLRKKMTAEEIKLWLQLKHFNTRGFNFRRQAPADGYILDFAEFGCKLIIEVDGSQHSEGVREKIDTIRDEHFQSKGFTVLRFWNIQINRQMDGVIDHIVSVLPKSPPALRATSPKGEEKK